MKSKTLGKISELERKYQELLAKFEWLYHWALRQDEDIRDIISKIGGIETPIVHNAEIFEYKWKALGKGVSSLENPEQRP